jgi:hypothetical protein
MTGRARLRHALFAPVLGNLLRNRILDLSLAVGGTLQVAATLARLPAMPCPFRHLTHVPCPGCGLSRACAALLRGNFTESRRMHLFAPLFLAAILLFWMAGLLTPARREAWANWVARFERRTALPTLLLIALLLYWLSRLLYAPDAFLRLMRD